MTKVLSPDQKKTRKPKTDIVSQTITEYCNEIRQLREALNNAIAAGELLKHQLAEPESELSRAKRQLAFDLIEKATATVLSSPRRY